MVKGKLLLNLFEETRHLIEKELVDLKLLTTKDIKNQDPEKPASFKYYPHNVSHFLGLDVHDVGYFHKPLKPGMVLTCEPGIYIREEGFGIRLENNILITNSGNVDLFENIPIEADEIEELMNKK
jgi:Xaa-Pro aminopeptidase